MRRLSPLIATVLGVTACTDSNGPGGSANVQVSFATQRPTSVQPAVMAPDTIVHGADTVVVTKAEIVLREVELKRREINDCDVDACESFAIGPVLVDLPLGPGVEPLFAASVPPGTYVRLEFDVHAPDAGDPVDSAFVTAHPDFADISIRVQGTYNGQTFVFTTNLNVSQELPLTPPLLIADATDATNITILFRVAEWFRRVDGSLLDPFSVADHDLIETNIKDSVEAFEDENQDGDNG